MPSLVGKGLTGHTVDDIIVERNHIRNKPFPALVIKSGLMDKTVTVAYSYLKRPHPIYRKYGGKVKDRTTLMVHDPGRSPTS